MKMKKFLKTSILVSILFFNISVFAGSEKNFKGITNPCSDVTLSFVQPGSISKINFKEGDIVQINDVLVQQDDSVEQIRLEQLKADSEDITSITYAEIIKQQRIVDLERLEEAGPDAIGPKELDYARLSLQEAELQLHIAQFQHEQTKRKYEEAKKQLDRMSLKSPIEGIIQEIFKETGESVNAIEKVIRIVRIDPLWIDIEEVPYVQAAKLKYGDKAIVEFSEPNKSQVEGVIIFKAAYGNASVDFLKIRVQVPNENNRPARENVFVSFPILD